nr:MAG TPA: hypothetical protein [Caudoviricetes sp.]DAT61166.1 MAG TPA: hypothetical protein [Caudoviricetes sp.]
MLSSNTVYLRQKNSRFFTRLVCINIYFPIASNAPAK